MADCINPILAYTTRSGNFVAGLFTWINEVAIGLVEMVHRGVFCCVKTSQNGENKVLLSGGDQDQLFYGRSSMKFVQILPLIESGAAEHFGFSDEELAVMCSSHNAEQRHLDTVRSILSKAVCVYTLCLFPGFIMSLDMEFFVQGLQETDLACGGHTPVSEAAAFEYVRKGAPTPFKDHIYNNCSGKHAAFLALSKYLGAPTASYLQAHHPVQQRIIDTICDFFGLERDKLHVGVDGCRWLCIHLRVLIAVCSMNPMYV